MDLKDDLVKSKQSIGVNKYDHPTGTLAMNLLKPSGGAHPYDQFVYGPQKIS